MEFPGGLDDSTIVAFKTAREREIAIGRDYLFEPMAVGECRVIAPEDDSRGFKDGEIVFIRQGPINLMPFVDAYEKRNKERHNGALKPILEGKHGLSERDLQKREKTLINAYIQFPCKASKIATAKGKVPNSLNSPIFIEYDNYLKLIAQYLPDPLHQNADFIAFLRDNGNLLD